MIGRQCDGKRPARRHTRHHAGGAWTRQSNGAGGVWPGANRSRRGSTRSRQQEERCYAQSQTERETRNLRWAVSTMQSVAKPPPALRESGGGVVENPMDERKM